MAPIRRTADCKLTLHAKEKRGLARFILLSFTSSSISRDRVTILTIYKSFIRARLEYACPFWDSYYVMNILRLEEIQRRVVYVTDNLDPT